MSEFSRLSLNTMTTKSYTLRQAGDACRAPRPPPRAGARGRGGGGRVGAGGDDPCGQHGVLRGVEQRAEVRPAARDQDHE